MTPDLKALATRWFEEVWNQRRAATIHELTAEGCLAQLEGTDELLTPKEFEAYWRLWCDAVPDIRMDVEFVVVDGQTAVVHWRARGTHLGAGLGIPPSGGVVNLTGLTVFEFENGLIVRGFDRWNRGELIASLMQVRMDELCEHARLTPREAQVSLLMADRFTHVEIAGQLRITPNTARRHCERVLNKLGVPRRQDVAAAIGKIPGSVLERHGADVTRGQPA
ncbi:MAG TPA: ester cyclase [Longimicrobiales bacterium]